MKYLISLDCSLNHCGISFIPISKNYNKIKYCSLINGHIGRMSKQFYFANSIIKNIENIQNNINANDDISILIEGYAYGTRGKDTSDSMFKEMMGYLFYKLIYDCRYNVYIISPMAPKNWAVGSSRGMKPDEKKSRSKNMKSNTVRFIENKIKHNIKLELFTKNNKQLRLMTYDDLELKQSDKVRFEDVADSLLNGLFFIENEYWNKTECYNDN